MDPGGDGEVWVAGCLVLPATDLRSGYGYRRAVALLLSVAIAPDEHYRESP
jgi:hypothetical protein